MRRSKGWAACLLLALALLQISVQAAPPRPGAPKRPSTPSTLRTLQRSDAKRWQRLKEVMQAEVKVNTKKFLQEREQVRDWGLVSTRTGLRGLPVRLRPQEQPQEQCTQAAHCCSLLAQPSLAAGGPGQLEDSQCGQQRVN